MTDIMKPAGRRRKAGEPRSINYVRDINFLIDTFVGQVYQGKELCLREFKALWKELGFTFIHQACSTPQTNRDFVQQLFTVALDRLDTPSPLKAAPLVPADQAAASDAAEQQAEDLDLDEDFDLEAWLQVAAEEFDPFDPAAADATGLADLDAVLGPATATQQGLFSPAAQLPGITNDAQVPIFGLPLLELPTDLDDIPSHQQAAGPTGPAGGASLLEPAHGSLAGDAATGLMAAGGLLSAGGADLPAPAAAQAVPQVPQAAASDGDHAPPAQHAANLPGATAAGAALAGVAALQQPPAAADAAQAAEDGSAAAAAAAAPGAGAATAAEGAEQPRNMPNLQQKVPLEAVAAAVFTVYCLYETQITRPKVPVYISVQQLEVLVRHLVPELEEAGYCEAAAIPSHMHRRDCLMLGFIRPPPITSAVRQKPQKEGGLPQQLQRDVLFHLKGTLRGLASVRGLHVACQQYEAAKASMFKPPQQQNSEEGADSAEGPAASRGGRGRGRGRGRAKAQRAQSVAPAFVPGLFGSSLATGLRKIAEEETGRVVASLQQALPRKPRRGGAAGAAGRSAGSRGLADAAGAADDLALAEGAAEMEGLLGPAAKRQRRGTASTGAGDPQVKGRQQQHRQDLLEAGILREELDADLPVPARILALERERQAQLVQLASQWFAMQDGDMQAAELSGSQQGQQRGASRAQSSSIGGPGRPSPSAGRGCRGARGGKGGRSGRGAKSGAGTPRGGSMPGNTAGSSLQHSLSGAAGDAAGAAQQQAAAAARPWLLTDPPPAEGYAEPEPGPAPRPRQHRARPTTAASVSGRATARGAAQAEAGPAAGEDQELDMTLSAALDEQLEEDEDVGAELHTSYAQQHQQQQHQQQQHQQQQHQQQQHQQQQQQQQGGQQQGGQQGRQAASSSNGRASAEPGLPPDLSPGAAAGATAGILAALPPVAPRACKRPAARPALHAAAGPSKRRQSARAAAAPAAKQGMAGADAQQAAPSTGDVGAGSAVGGAAPPAGAARGGGVSAADSVLAMANKTLSELDALLGEDDDL